MNVWGILGCSLVFGTLAAGCSSNGGGGGCIGAGCGIPADDSGVVAGLCGNRVCGPNINGAGSCGTCAVGMECSGGQCVPGACSSTSPTGACPGGQICLSGTCCLTTQICAGMCCPAGQTCTAGVCTAPTQPCSAAFPTGSCPADNTCIRGVCCRNTSVCGSMGAPLCCPAGQACATDGTCCTPENGSLSCTRILTAMCARVVMCCSSSRSCQTWQYTRADCITQFARNGLDCSSAAWSSQTFCAEQSTRCVNDIPVIACSDIYSRTVNLPQSCNGF